MIEDLRKHYRDLAARFGDDHRAVQHADRASQLARFRVLTDHITEQPFRLLDVGCGLGHLYDFLEERFGKGFTYLGVDFLSEFIEGARKRLQGRPNAQFRTLDISKDPLPTGFDHVLVCGVFNNRTANSEAFMLKLLREMFRATQRTITFNAMSTYVDFQNPDLFYSDPRVVFDFCKRELTRRVTLRHDYIVKAGSIPYEYTIYAYKDEAAKTP